MKPATLPSPAFTIRSLRPALGFRTFGLFGLLLSLAACSTAEPSAVDRFGPIPELSAGEQRVLEPFRGVRILARTTSEPRPLRYFVAFIDPKAEDLRFFVTPPNGDAPRETDHQSTRAFLEEHACQLAINAHFFAPFPTTDAHTDVLGLSISEGERYSEPQEGFEHSFTLLESGEARIVDHADAEESAAVELEGARNAVAGNERILRAGIIEASWEELHPRTAIGVREDGVVLFLIVDGRQEGISEGMTTPELGKVFLELGATDAINLDGGGSTTLAINDGETRLLNDPVGYLFPGTERSNGSNLCVFAQSR